MTGLEVESLGGIGDSRRSGSVWSRLLVPIVAAVIVLALGLVLVGLTAGDAEPPPLSPPAAQAGIG
ncbi:MAG: hypothetical protein KAJ97_00325 [Acidobacteria bacterium]|nr:hypothetical protein [Acidobacteriota bacterium]